MKVFRFAIASLACAIFVLSISNAATAGGKGDPARLVIEGVILINLRGGVTRAEISGGGFLDGAPPVASLDGAIMLSVVEVSSRMLVADIPPRTPDGDYSLMVSTGDTNKQNASTPISLGGTMSAVCIDWFRSGPADEHVHTEVHVEDENGNPVIGAVVTWTAENDVVGVYQTNVSATYDNDGHADGQGCVDPTGSGVTDWFCCIGAGKWDGGIPGKRACDKGFYTAEILSVTAPPATNMEWDGVTPENGIFLDPKPQ
jgi:hypothetical protein